MTNEDLSKLLRRESEQRLRVERLQSRLTMERENLARITDLICQYALHHSASTEHPK